MDVLANLRIFLAVARHGGFSEAARQLHVVPSVVAKRIAQLEKTMFRAHLARRR
jgi:DNA-binding transcriptional LysR family regulator